VVDMLLTGFDSKYLNTLYVDKNLKHHGLIQAFSRTNRVLNDTKPYGNILDFRQQQNAVEAAIALFSGERTDGAREIWLVDPAPVVIEKYQAAVAAMEKFLVDRELLAEPDQVSNLQGDAARVEFITRFKEVQRLKTQLDQYTDLSPQQLDRIEAILPTDDLQGFRSTYLETAKRLKDDQDRGKAPDEVQQLDFEFVLFASAVIDYDYIMGLIAKMTQQKPGKTTLSRDQLIGMIQGDAKFLDDRDDIAQYIRGLPLGQGLNENEVHQGYQTFRAEKKARELATIAAHHGLDPAALSAFVDDVLRRRVFDGEALSELMEPLNLGWKARTQKELALVDVLTPLLNKLAQGRAISGLDAYEQR